MIAPLENPPLLDDYSKLVHKLGNDRAVQQDHHDSENEVMVIEEYCELPLIDLSGLASNNVAERVSCALAICKASSEWGFFQVVNHGISLELLRKMREEQVMLFKAPFEHKANCGLFNNSYRWGNRTATCAKQLSWNEAFHVPLFKISEEDGHGEYTSLREVMQEYAHAMQKLANSLSEILVKNLGQERAVFEESCDESTCFLRLNRYPACPIAPEVFGLVPHTDSDLLTILHQDEVGGLQLMKDSKWVAVKPNKNALIVNIGDLFQAWSNDVYKSVEHKVMVNSKMERYSIAYFLCPSNQSYIGSCCKGKESVYRDFTFGEYRNQIQLDVKNTGHKVGLPRFLSTY